MKQRSPQTKFSNPEFRSKLSFGGSLLTKSKNRHARPVSTKESMHLVLKSSKAKGRYSLRHSANSIKVRAIVENNCAKYGVQLIKFSNNFNHLHLLLKFPSRPLYLKFIRSITAQIAMAVTSSNKAKSLKSIFGESGFWDFRPFSRIVKGFRGFKVTNNYVRLNQLEAEGIIPKRSGRFRCLKDAEFHLFKTSSPANATTVDLNLSFNLN
jgi:putative transposase